MGPLHGAKLTLRTPQKNPTILCMKHILTLCSFSLSIILQCFDSSFIIKNAFAVFLVQVAIFLKTSFFMLHSNSEHKYYLATPMSLAWCWLAGGWAEFRHTIKVLPNEWLLMGASPAGAVLVRAWLLTSAFPFLTWAWTIKTHHFCLKGLQIQHSSLLE